ncbi:MAG: hypothetical protein PHQ52_06060 [Candidatus Omnitrophica bacterium]|nr:hypothetical protein [Candidatus Omnitrophota bacterium]
MVINKCFFVYIFIYITFNLYIPYSYASIFSREIEMYNANRSKAKAKVDIFTDQVTQIRENGKWVKLSGNAQKAYQNRYEVQKKVVKKQHKKKEWGK